MGAVAYPEIDKQAKCTGAADGTPACRRQASDRGVRGHALPEKCELAAHSRTTFERVLHKTLDDDR